MIVGLIVAGCAPLAAKPAMDLDWYGYIKLDAAYDQNLTSHGNFVMWVNPKTRDGDDAQFNLTANETRIGLKAKSSSNDNLKIDGNLEFDLFAGVSGSKVAENKGMLQLRHAYFAIKRGNLKLIAGQTWDLVSPLNPSTLNYPVLWACGNTGYRRPQLSVFYDLAVDPCTNLELAAGLFRTIGGDLLPDLSMLPDEEADGNDDGTDAALPTIQGRADVKHAFPSGGSLRAGVSALWGSLEAETNYGNSESYESWLVVAHMAFAANKRFGLSGEAFTGSNMSAYLGGILNSSSIDGVSASGGWGAAWGLLSQAVRLSVGAGMDDPDDQDIADGNRARNECIYTNIIYEIAPGAIFGLEVSHWQTAYVNSDTEKSLRVQTSLKLNF